MQARYDAELFLHSFEMISIVQHPDHPVVLGMKSGEVLPDLTPRYLFMLGRSAASKFINVRPAGGPENTSNNDEILA